MVEKSLRYRVNISTSVKGIKTWDCTIEIVAPENEMDALLTGEKILTTTRDISTESQILALSDRLVKELEKRYPPEIPEPKR